MSNSYSRDIVGSIFFWGGGDFVDNDTLVSFLSKLNEAKLGLFHVMP